MKRKIILALMTICILSFVSCGKQETTATAESIPTAVESAQVETTETTTETIESTEVVEDNTSEAEAKDESTEAEKTTEVTNIEEAEPLSEKDLAFSFLGCDTYNEYVEAGNDEAAYMLADNANMIVSGEFTDDGNVIESTVRGIKLGDSIDKVIELYGDTKQRSADIKDVFSHDGLKDSGAYNYFLKIDCSCNRTYFNEVLVRRLNLTENAEGPTQILGRLFTERRQLERVSP